MHNLKKFYWAFVVAWLVALAAFIVAVDRRFSEDAEPVERGQQ